ncbi:MAG: MATE family efflux transporter [Raoultibacter sp.]
MKKNIYENSSLVKLIFIFGIPSILSLMIEMLTGIVDTAFAGNLPGMGSDALAAMALLAPVLGIFTALQTLFALSTGILIAKYMNNASKLNDSYTTGVVMSVVVSTVTSFVCYGALSVMLTTLGAQGRIFDLAQQYLQIQLLSNVFSSVGYTLTCCIRAFGFPKVEVLIITGAVVINIIFNFTFAFVFNMGIAGLAWGTFVSESVCAVCSVLFLMKKKLWLCAKPIPIPCFFQRAGELFKIGIAQTAIQALGGCTGFVVNAQLLEVGSMTFVASWSVVQRIYTFILVPVVGLTQGVQNIISYFNGNDAPEKIEKVSKITMLLCGSYGIIALVMVMNFGYDLAALFGGSSEIVEQAQTILLIVFLGFPFIGVLYTDMTLLQVTGHEFSSVLLILSRQVFFLIPLISVVPACVAGGGWDLPPVMALFFCMPLSDVLSVLFALAVKRGIASKRARKLARA